MHFIARTLKLLAIASLAVAPVSAHAGEDCTCRGNGKDVAEGQTICLKTAAGPKLARCERVLNNTSWKILDTDCPLARSTPALELLQQKG
ncbi:hypothetical protein [Oricola sp.]|uniref:hypothetical protein n=1 Tax=Oricola sp. TaxID=1979950 RepID=UPI003BA88426